MPKADDSHIIGRRSILHGFIPVATFAGSSTFSVHRSADAILIAQCQEYLAVERSIDEIDKWPDGPPGSNAATQHEACLGALSARQLTLLRSIAALPARTPEGLAAKADTVRHYLRPLLQEFAPDPDGPEAEIALDLLDDITVWNKGSLS